MLRETIQTGNIRVTTIVDEVSIITSFSFNFLWLKFVSENTTKRAVELRISAALESLGNLRKKVEDGDVGKQ